MVVSFALTSVVTIRGANPLALRKPGEHAACGTVLHISVALNHFSTGAGLPSNIVGLPRLGCEASVGARRRTGNTQAYVRRDRVVRPVG
jgi:hypothetical protein